MESSAKIASLDGKLAERKKKLEEVEEESGRLKLELEGKVKAMRDMEEEIWRLKSNDSQTEALSTSTISKVEETARLADLEESFEERYSKVIFFYIQQIYSIDKVNENLTFTIS